MRAVKMAILAGAFGTLTSISTFAVPLDITLTGGSPSENYGESLLLDPGFQNVALVANQSQVSSINLAGVNSMSVTWAAPAGYMYVINPPPAGLAGNGDSIWFQAQYGNPGQASSLGSITSSSFSIHSVYGTSPFAPFAAGAEISNTSQNGPALTFGVFGGMSPSSEPFAFTSLTISAAFSGTGSDTTLNKTASDIYAEFFGSLTADFEKNGLGPNSYYIPPDPGLLFNLEPLPSGSAPDASSTLSLAGLGFAGLFFVGRKRPVNC